MSTNADAFAAFLAALREIPFLAALGEMPTRMAAVERETATVAAELTRIRAALPPALVSVPEAAASFQVSVPTMRRWVKTGAVPTVKVGKTIRVDLARLHGKDELAIARAAQTRGVPRG